MAAKTMDAAENAAPVRKKSILKGALAGLVGGLVGTAVKTMAEAIIPPRLDGYPAPPALLAEKVADHPLDSPQKAVATESIHWIFGPLAGAAYGAIAEMRPQVAAWGGIAFGLTLNRITHEGLLPKAGLAPPVLQQPMQQRVSEWVSHAAYGVTTDIVRRGVRTGLG
jgi:putative membrane protein